MPIECCDEYKLIQLIPEEFRVVFRFLTYIYIWVNSRSRHGSARSIGDSWWRNGSFPVHGVQQVETAATSTLAHVQQFAVASTTETTETLVGRADVEWHIMREDTIVEQATAKEITHEDVEVVCRMLSADNFIDGW